MIDPGTEEQYEILPDDYTQFDLSFKIIVVGDCSVGKSSFTNKATRNIFDDDYNATIGFEFFTFNIKMYGKIIKLQIWDTCGQELYRSLITNFYRNSSFAIVVYAVNSQQSFDDLEIWFRELRTHANPDIKTILVGNKIDLKDERKVTTKQGEDFSKLNNVHKFIEASAKEGINTTSTFIYIAKMLYEEHSKFEEYTEQDKEFTEKFKINDSLSDSIQPPKMKKKNPEEKERKQKKCC